MLKICGVDVKRGTKRDNTAWVAEGEEDVT
jgi:hypothetical protein